MMIASSFLFPEQDHSRDGSRGSVSRDAADRDRTAGTGRAGSGVRRARECAGGFENDLPNRLATASRFTYPWCMGAKGEFSGEGRAQGTMWVVLQFAFLAAMAMADSLLPTSVPALLLWLFGFLLAVWAAVAIGPTRIRIHPRPAHHARLVRYGPYKRLRHPMYLAVLLVALGWLVDRPGGLRALLLLGLWLVLCGKAAYEEKLLRLRFSEYATYQQTTWRILPWIY